MNICQTCGTVDAEPLYPVRVMQRAEVLGYPVWLEAGTVSVCRRCAERLPDGWRRA